MRANRDRTRALVFDQGAAAYEAGRPELPPEVCDALWDQARLNQAAAVLEVGAGTGQLSIALAQRGAALTALEPGPRLAERLRRALHPFPDASIIVTSFEDHEPAASYEAVVAADAFHWLDPSHSYEKAADLLAPTGSLALIWTFPVLADHELQSELNRVAFRDELADLQRAPLTHVDEIHREAEAGRDELAASGRFAAPSWQWFEVNEEWSRDRYIAWLSTLASMVGKHQEVRTALAPCCPAHVEVRRFVYLQVAAHAP